MNRPLSERIRDDQPEADPCPFSAKLKQAPLTPPHGLKKGQKGRVLLVTSNFPRWLGDSTTPFVLHLAGDLQAQGWCVDVLAPHAPHAARAEQIQGVTIERFRYFWPETHETICYQGGALINLRQRPENWAKLPFLVASEWAAVRRRLATGRYDVLNSHWILPQGLTGVLAAKSLGVPHVITVHGGDVFALRGRMLSRCKRFALNQADAVTVNSSATEQAVRAIAPGLSSVTRIPIGVTEREADPRRVAELRRHYRKNEGPLLVFAGRLVAEKGVEDVIRATAQVSDTQPDVTCLIVGDGQDRPGFERLSGDLGLSDKVTFTGWVDPDDVLNHLAAGDIFIGPSRQSPEGWVEAQGLTFAEAMLAGTPVIATRSGGIPDTVRHGDTGVLVDEASPDQVAAGVVEILTRPGLAQEIAQRGRTYARANLTRRRTAASFSSLFEALPSVAISGR